MENYPEAWANEILPIAREAHTRLRFEHVKPALDHEKMVAEGDAVEQPMSDGMSYRVWSGRVVLEEMHKAGWRLADLLAQVAGPVESDKSRVESSAKSVVIYDQDQPQESP